MMATTSSYNFWLYELCDVYIVSFLTQTLCTGVLKVSPTGSNEAYDGRVRSYRYPKVCSTDIVHVSRLWLAPSTSLHAICDRRVMAAFTPKARRSYTVNHGLIVSRICEWSRSISCGRRYLNSHLCQDNAFVFEEADKQFDLVFSALKAGRSLAASYNLQSDIQRMKYLILTCPNILLTSLTSLPSYSNG
jgi:hypothetical protein